MPAVIFAIKLHLFFTTSAKGKLLCLSLLKGICLHILEKPSRGLPRVVTQHSHRQRLQMEASEHSLGLEPADQAACPPGFGSCCLPRSSSGLRAHSHCCESAPLPQKAATPCSKKPWGWDSQTQPFPSTSIALNLRLPSLGRGS